MRFFRRKKEAPQVFPEPEISTPILSSIVTEDEAIPFHELSFDLGKDSKGESVVISPFREGHILLYGNTGSGKTTFSTELLVQAASKGSYIVTLGGITPLTGIPCVFNAANSTQGGGLVALVEIASRMLQERAIHLTESENLPPLVIHLPELNVHLSDCQTLLSSSEYELLIDKLLKILRVGRAVGGYVVVEVTSSRRSLPSVLLDALRTDILMDPKLSPEFKRGTGKIAILDIDGVFEDVLFSAYPPRENIPPLTALYPELELIAEEEELTPSNAENASLVVKTDS